MGWYLNVNKIELLYQRRNDEVNFLANFKFSSAGIAHFERNCDPLDRVDL